MKREKDIERLEKVNVIKTVQSIKDIYKNAEQNSKKRAIQELEEIKRILYESHYREIDNKYYAEMEDIECVIDQRIKWLKGE